MYDIHTIIYPRRLCFLYCFWKESYGSQVVPPSIILQKPYFTIHYSTGCTHRNVTRIYLNWKTDPVLSQFIQKLLYYWKTTYNLPLILNSSLFHSSLLTSFTPTFTAVRLNSSTHDVLYLLNLKSVTHHSSLTRLL